MKCLTRIEGKISHMETLLKSLDIVEKKVSEFDSELKKLWTYIMDTRKSLKRGSVRLNKMQKQSTSQWV